jgi:hypothetical protein
MMMFREDNMDMHFMSERLHARLKELGQQYRRGGKKRVYLRECEKFQGHGPAQRGVPRLETAHVAERRSAT